MDELTKWAMEIQSIAQAGLTYCKDVFCRERYERLREISAEMISVKTDLPTEKVRTLFCGETGYQTPKIDTRAAIFKKDRILLVKENDGRWSLPGGWCEYNCSPTENAVKEVREEAGLNVEVSRLIAVQDRKKHNKPEYAWGVVKMFFLCSFVSGEFTENSETTASAYFAENELPALAEEKNTAEQIHMCFEALKTDKVLFD